MGEEGAAIVENERGSGSPKRKSVSPKRDEAEGGASPKRKSVSPKRSSVSPKRAESPEKKVDLETQVRNHKDAITMEGADASDMLGALEGLYALDITVDLLRSTMIGKAVNQMVKASEDAEVKAKAKELVMKWKNQSGVPIKRKPSNDIPVNDQMAKRLRGMGNAPKKATHAPSPAAASGGRAPSPKKPVAAVQDLTKVMDVKLTGIRQRDMVRSKLFTSLRPREDEEDKEPAELAVQIELAMQKHLWPSSREAMKDESKAYMDQVRAVIFNLKDKKNLTFRKRVLVGAIQAQDLPTMLAIDMASDEKNKERSDIRQHEMEAVQTDWAKKNGELQISGMFTCGKCKGTQTTYFQMQTRSSDEPMTTFVTCLTCANRWKFC